MVNQNTITNICSTSGEGIHTGEAVRLELRPAAENAGVRFFRKDLDEHAALTIENLCSDGQLGRTTLKHNGLMVQTVEHVLAAAAGMGVDNLDVVLDASEPPAMDGSAEPFARMLAEAGVIEQSAERVPLVIKEPLSVSEGGASIAALPWRRGLKITYTLHYEDQPLAQGHQSFIVNPKTFLSEIAPARTFCMKHEVEQARALGMGKGATSQNTLVIDGDTVLENSFRFENEPLRHKVLDALGDLSLVGRPIVGHIVCICSGHRLNGKMATLIRKMALDGMPKKIAMGARDILAELKISSLECRLDQVTERSEDKLAAIKNVSSNQRAMIPGPGGGLPASEVVISCTQAAQLLAGKPLRLEATLSGGGTVAPGTHMVIKAQRTGDGKYRVSVTVAGEVICECSYS